MALLAIDIGTTHCKAGLFDMAGKAVKIASRPTISRQSAGGWVYYDPQDMLDTVAGILTVVTQKLSEPVAALGIASMAETGLLVDRQTGQARSPFLPWFETSPQPVADWIDQHSDALECYLRFGARVSFKASLSKLLWLRQELEPGMQNAVWLSVADYIAYWLTGEFGTDYSLAGRTMAFRLDRRQWDDDWLRNWGLPVDLFPPAHTSGVPLGKVKQDQAGLRRGTPVAVSGHDHVCAALAMGAVQPGIVFDSIGTAETLLGALADDRPLTAVDFENGLLVGCHVVEGLRYWMGSLSASGGSVEWLRKIVQPPSASYADLEKLLDSASPQPTGILYFPYLLGSGSPHANPWVRGAFIGLNQAHQQPDLLKAVLEGTAFELEMIRQAGETMTGSAIATLAAAGGGTRNRAWMQIKADVSGCRIAVSDEPEATLLGAAIAAGIGCRLFASPAEALAAMGPRSSETFIPTPRNHARYRALYEHGYLPFQGPLRRFANSNEER